MTTGCTRKALKSRCNHLTAITAAPGPPWCNVAMELDLHMYMMSGKMPQARCLSKGPPISRQRPSRRHLSPWAPRSSLQHFQQSPPSYCWRYHRLKTGRQARCVSHSIHRTRAGLRACIGGEGQTAERTPLLQNAVATIVGTMRRRIANRGALVHAVRQSGSVRIEVLEEQQCPADRGDLNPEARHSSLVKRPWDTQLTKHTCTATTHAIGQLTWHVVGPGHRRRGSECSSSRGRSKLGSQFHQPCWLGRRPHAGRTHRSAGGTRPLRRTTRLEWLRPALDPSQPPH